jgi:nitrogenase-associated protein
MCAITFYAKPGCATNARQRRLLESGGHDVRVRDLLAEPWTCGRLREFFAGVPVAYWLNPAAPRVKSGDIDPRLLGPESVMALLLAEPLLIRRPLLEIGAARLVGFDPAVLRRYIDLPEQLPAMALPACARDPRMRIAWSGETHS